jgi:hypothetical protein
MNRIVLAVLVLGCAMPAVAGVWDPFYVWDSGKTKYETEYEGTGYTRIVDWGDPVAYDAPYRESSGLYASPKIPDRQGRYNATYGGELDWTGSTGGKVKWRFDHSTNPAGRVPPGGHSPDYSVGIPSSVKLGMEVCSGQELISYVGSGTNYPTAFVPDDSGYPRITTGGAGGSMDMRWYNTPQAVAGISSNWKPSNATALGAIGNWLMPANSWANIQVIFDNNAAKTWRARLDRDGYATGYMWGTYTGNASTSLQFGITSTKNNYGVAYDYLAFGWGEANIPDVPEPASLMLLGLGAMSLIRRRIVR